MLTFLSSMAPIRRSIRKLSACYRTWWRMRRRGAYRGVEECFVVDTCRTSDGTAPSLYSNRRAGNCWVMSFLRHNARYLKFCRIIVHDSK